MMLSSQPLADATPPGSVFASVFSSSNIKPPRERQRFTPAAAQSLPVIETSLKDHLRALLGIGDEECVYGQPGPAPGHGAPFSSHFPSCPPWQQIRQPSVMDHAAQSAKDSKSSLWSKLSPWAKGVGPHTLKKLLAQVLDELMTEFITWSYSGVYRDGLYHHLEFWVQHFFSRIAHTVLLSLDTNQKTREHLFQDTELRKYQTSAVARLGALRVEELFDVIVDWDATAPAIDDLRHFTTNPTTRSYLTYNFANALQTRLLHPGASTIEILQVYISIIRSFRILDPKGVLLDRVARKIRRYLRERDDTVKVIVAGLLADPPSTNPNPEPNILENSETLSELAVELTRTATASQDSIQDSEFDWNNMSWVPDPVDAAPDYMKSKNTDVIGSLITLFDTKDVFVKELQAMLAERLLKHKPDFTQEISVLEHLKIRFGDSTLQGCEVMLRDVLDSRKVDGIVRKERGMQQAKPQQQSTTSTLDPTTTANQPPSSPSPTDIGLHVKILSRLFWPSMADHAFKVPQIVAEQQQSYELGFEALKQSRKLTWINAIGQVEVELELHDRTYRDQVLPWQAAVIYAFDDFDDQNKENDDNEDEDADNVDSIPPPTTRTISQLSSDLEMSATLVRSACIFWVSKQILAETGRDTFTVLERLDQLLNPNDPNHPHPKLQSNDTTTSGHDPSSASTAAAAAAAATIAAAQAAKESEEAERKQKMAIYHQFIVSMLTNQGAMPLPRIAMMLGIVVPGGFPFSNEELKEFLAGMVKDSVLEVGNGGVYKAVM
ncbi:hypothetical protein PV10_06261 [Exophiala mesophila]|uniref:Anaphase-promoting complex subunit 2 n=1 Tax=Exophiala mesophila TaxID=212818 RepID=A0A0D1ZCS5_EXOME|nr:uncharacterized protein PV10_06261 [Exophiala mesophila]KIV91754.1 hypothetical protein PV10_06261 [Exophiala mesophila]